MSAEETGKRSSFRRRVFDVIQIGNRGDWLSQGFDIAIVTTIILNLIVLILSTFDSMEPYKPIWDWIEWVTVIIFTIEYLLRLWTAEYLYPNQSPKTAWLRFILSFYGLIDLMSILPVFLPFIFPRGAVAFRMLRVFRVFRLFKINTQYDAFNVVIDVLKEKKQQLFSSICLILIMMLASSICMYGIEHEVQPEVFRNAFSGIWWSMSTLLTVGYGDIYPITVLGKSMAILIAFLGVGLVAIPTGIISAGFVEHYTVLKSLIEPEGGEDMQFVVLRIGPDHPWARKTIRDIGLVPGLVIVSVMRDNEMVIPRGDTELFSGDLVVIGAEAFRNELGIAVREFILAPGHPWIDCRLRQIPIAANQVIVMVKRGNEMLVPGGNLLFREQDVVTICEKK